MNNNTPDYKNIFSKLELTIRQETNLSEEEFELQFGKFKKYETRVLSDNECFTRLVMIVFYSGFRAATVENKEEVIKKHFPDYRKVVKYSENDIQRILSDRNMIKNELKIRSVVDNANTFMNVIEKFGSFQGYLNEFGSEDSFERLILLKEKLQLDFKYLGKITVYHFLMDLGYNVLKPDRVIQRIFKRLNLIENEKLSLKSIFHGRNFSKETNLPIRYIDIILVKYGQKGKSTEFGLKDGICLLQKPKCEKCALTLQCNYKGTEKKTGGNK